MLITYGPAEQQPPARKAYAPEGEDRFPCFATGATAPATMNAAAVGMLNVVTDPPPVPSVSTRSVGSDEATRTIALRRARTRPATSDEATPPRAQPHEKVRHLDFAGRSIHEAAESCLRLIGLQRPPFRDDLEQGSEIPVHDFNTHDSAHLGMGGRNPNIHAAIWSISGAGNHLDIAHTRSTFLRWIPLKPPAFA